MAANFNRDPVSTSPKVNIMQFNKQKEKNPDQSYDMVRNSACRWVFMRRNSWGEASQN